MSLTLESAMAEVKVCAEEPQITLVRFHTPQRCLSWAPWNGGLKTDIRLVANRTLGENEGYPDEASRLAQWAKRDLVARGLLPKESVGMLTTVPQAAICMGSRQDRGTGLRVETFCTLGLGNALAPGDGALYNEELGTGKTKPGTINLIVAVNRGLAECAQYELMSVITQAKCAVLLRHGKKSRVSGNICLGTGTDCIAILAPQSHEVTLNYAGLHCKLAEVTAQSVMQAVAKALEVHLSHIASLR